MCGHAPTSPTGCDCIINMQLIQVNKRRLESKLYKLYVLYYCNCKCKQKLFEILPDSNIMPSWLSFLFVSSSRQHYVYLSLVLDCDGRMRFDSIVLWNNAALSTYTVNIYIYIYI